MNADYINYAQGRCPCCESGSLEYDEYGLGTEIEEYEEKDLPVDLEENCVAISFDCNDCDIRGHEIYSLSYSDSNNKPKGKCSHCGHDVKYDRYDYTVNKNITLFEIAFVCRDCGSKGIEVYDVSFSETNSYIDEND